MLQAGSARASSTMLAAVEGLGRASRAIESFNATVFACLLWVAHGLHLRDYVLALVCSCIRN